MILYSMLLKYSNFSCCNVFKTVVGIFLLTTSFGYSQNCNLSITGKVISFHDKKPLETAVVQIVGETKNAVTSVDGVFVFENLCPKKLTIKISHINCEDFVTKIDLTASVTLELFMDHHIETLEEVVISKERTDKLSSTTKVYSLTESEKERYNTKGLAGALEQISGVNTLSTGNSIAKPVIHGMFGSRVGIVYNNLMLENQQWGQDHAPNIDINAFEDIRVIKGASALKYAGSIAGGIVVLESSLPIPIDSLYGKTILNGMTNGKGMGIVSSWVKSYENGTYIKAQGTLRKNGDFSAPNYMLTNTGSHEKNIALSVGKNGFHSMWNVYFSYFNTEIAILKSAHIGSIRDLLGAIEADSPSVIEPFAYGIESPKQANTHHTTSLSYSKFLSSNQKLNIKYSWQKNNREEYDLRRGDLKYTPAIDLRLNTHDITTNYEWSRNKGSYDGGLFFQVQDNYSNPDTEVRRLIPDYLKVKWGGYATASFNLSDKVNYAIGMRYEHQSNDVRKWYRNNRWESKNYEELLGSYVINEVVGQRLVSRDLIFNTVSFSTGVRYMPSSRYRIALNFNYAERAPDIAEMFSDGLHHSLATIEYGNPFLTKEKTHKLVLDVEKREGLFTFIASPFITFGEHYIIIEPTGVEQTIRGAFPVWEYSAVNALLAGIDVDLTYEINSELEFRQSTSWVHGTNKNTEKPLIIPPVTTTNQIRYSPQKWNAFSIALHSKITFTQHRFPLNNPDDVPVIENGQKLYKEVDISTPPNGYHNLGLDLNWGPYKIKESAINIGLSFDNLFNVGYRDYMNRLRFYADEAGRNVMFQIKISH
ncbi:MAG: TonB-dependent receptor [Flavobacteriaceae bacterium]|nr:TonB-dependent receptor [Flavobacteriaceae bacterium]